MKNTHMDFWIHPKIEKTKRDTSEGSGPKGTVESFNRKLNGSELQWNTDKYEMDAKEHNYTRSKAINPSFYYDYC